LNCFIHNGEDNMKLKKLIFLVTFILFFNLVKVDTLAKVNATLVVDKEIFSGEEVAVSIGLDNVSIITQDDEIDVLMLYLQYDSSKFTVPFAIETAKEAIISASAIIPSENSLALGLTSEDIICKVYFNNPNVIEIQILYSLLNKKLDKDGEIFKLIFQAKEDAYGDCQFLIDDTRSVIQTNKVSNPQNIIDNQNANIQVEVISKDTTINSLYVTSLGKTYYGKYVDGFYEILVPKDTTTVDLYVEPRCREAKVTNTGTYSLVNARKELTVTVTAQDGVTQATYNVLIRPMKSINLLTRLEIIGSEFLIDGESVSVINLDESHTSYNLKVKYANNLSLKFNVKQGSNALIYYNNQSISILSYNQAFINEEIVLDVIAEDGSKRTYTFNLTMEDSFIDTSIEYVRSNVTVDIKNQNNTYTLTYPYSNNNKVQLIIKPKSSTTLVRFVNSTNYFIKINDEYVSNEIIIDPTKTNLNLYIVELVASDNSVATYTFNLLMANRDERSGLLNIYLNDEPLANFSKNKHTYDLGVIPTYLSSLYISVEKENPYSTVTGIGHIELGYGANVIIITVTDQKPLYGETQNISYYYLTYYRKKLNSLTNLEYLKVNGESLDLNETNFTLEYPFKNSTVYIEAKLHETSVGANISGDLGYKELNIGLNEFRVIVESEDGLNKITYNIYIRRQDITLNKLEIDFLEVAMEDDKYYLEVDYQVDHIYISAYPSDPSVNVIGDGWQILNLGLNTYKIRLISNDSLSLKEYVVEVYRKYPGNDASLEIIKLEELRNFTFEQTKNTYSIKVPWELQAITIYAKTKDPKAKIIESKSNEYEIKRDLSIGNNHILLTVEAEDGTIAIYSLIIERLTKLNTDSSLKLLEVEGIEVFDLKEQETLIKYFNLIVPYATQTIKVNAIPNSHKSIVFGATTYTLNEGFNQIDVSCYAEDGSYTIYRIYVFRESLSSDNYIEKLTIAEKEDFVFHKDIQSYILFFDKPIYSLNFDVELANDEATYKIIGNHGFKEGVNTVEIQVTALDGSVRTYTIFVNINYKLVENKKVDLKLIGIIALGITNITTIVFVLNKRRSLKVKYEKNK